MPNWRIRVATDGQQRLITRVGGEPSQLWAAFAGQANWVDVAIVEADNVDDAEIEANRMTGEYVPFRVPCPPS